MFSLFSIYSRTHWKAGIQFCIDIQNVGFRWYDDYTQLRGVLVNEAARRHCPASRESSMRKLILARYKQACRVGDLQSERIPILYQV